MIYVVIKSSLITFGDMATSTLDFYYIPTIDATPDVDSTARNSWNADKMVRFDIIPCPLLLSRVFFAIFLNLLTDLFLPCTKMARHILVYITKVGPR